MNIFIEIGVIVLIATLISFIAKFLKQPLIIGYILSGIIIGPYFLNFIHSAEYIELFSKFGVAILLFTIGIHLKPKIIREVGKVSLITGIGQIIFTSGLGYLIMRFLGFNNIHSLYGAIALTFSSTIIILKLLSDKGDLDKLYGKISTGFLLVQDLFATLILLAVSIWGSSSLKGNTFSEFSLLFIKGLFLVFILYLFGKYLLPKILDFSASSQELLFIFSIAWGLGLASLFYVFGFSLEIGALIAGVIIANSNYAQEIGAKMKPLRDFFILLFFVMLGSQMIFFNIGSIIYPVIVLSIFVLLGNPLIVFFLMNLLGYKRRTSFMAGLTVAQISEFSLILIALGFSFGHVNREIISLITLVGVITIIGSTYMILYSEKLYDKLKPILKFLEIRKNIKEKIEEKLDQADLVILGYDRVGYDFVTMAQKMKINYYVIDYDPKAIRKLKRKNISFYFGDAEDFDFLEEIRFFKAKIIISTIPDFETNLNLLSFYRNLNKEGIAILTSHNIKDTKEFYEHGASFVIMPYYLGAKYASEMIQGYGFDNKAFEIEKNKQLESLKEREILNKE